MSLPDICQFSGCSNESVHRCATCDLWTCNDHFDHGPIGDGPHLAVGSDAHELSSLRAELEQAQRAQCDCDFENMEQSQTCPIHGELAVRLTEARKDTARIDWIDRNMDCDLAGDGLHVSLVDIGDTQTIREAIDEAIALAATPAEPQEEPR